MLNPRWNDAELRELKDNLRVHAVADGDALVMEVEDERVLIDPSGLGDGEAATLTLPSVVAARGRIYSIRVTAAEATTGTFTIQDAGDADVSYSEATLDAQNDRVLLYSDGYLWHVLSSTIA